MICVLVRCDFDEMRYRVLFWEKSTHWTSKQTYIIHTHTRAHIYVQKLHESASHCKRRRFLFFFISPLFWCECVVRWRRSQTVKCVVYFIAKCAIMCYINLSNNRHTHRERGLYFNFISCAFCKRTKTQHTKQCKNLYSIKSNKHSEQKKKKFETIMSFLLLLHFCHSFCVCRKM